MNHESSPWPRHKTENKIAKQNWHKFSTKLGEGAPSLRNSFVSWKGHPYYTTNERNALELVAPISSARRPQGTSACHGFVLVVGNHEPSSHFQPPKKQIIMLGLDPTRGVISRRTIYPPPMKPISSPKPLHAYYQIEMPFFYSLTLFLA